MISTDGGVRAILSELTSNDPEVSSGFLDRYQDDVCRFAQYMAGAKFAQSEIATRWLGDHEDVVYVMSIVDCAAMLHIQSMKLFLSGHIIAAGNLSRQVIEAIAVALLCSGQIPNVLRLFREGSYRSDCALRNLRDHRDELGILESALSPLEDARKFYHRYSHLTTLTVAVGVPFYAPETRYIGASFDPGKIDQYDREVRSRLSLAEVFPNFIKAVDMNLAKWSK